MRSFIQKGLYWIYLKPSLVLACQLYIQYNKYKLVQFWPVVQFLENSLSKFQGYCLRVNLVTNKSGTLRNMYRFEAGIVLLPIPSTII